MKALPSKTKRLAIVLTHPVQYVAPWLAYLAQHLGSPLRVFYLHDPRLHPRDHGFGHDVRWDCDLLGGYDSEFVPNVARDPGTHHFFGLNNPGLSARLARWQPDAILLGGYAFATLLRLICAPRWTRTPFLFRGDSHELVPASGTKAVLRTIALPLLFSRFSAFLSVGRANRDYFRRHGVAARRLYHTPPTLDPQRFAAITPAEQKAATAWREQLGIPPDHRVVLFAGKFELKKRPDLLLEAFLRAGLPATLLLFVGIGPLEAKLRARAAGHETIRFAPFQNQSEMVRTYAAADLFVLPSQGRSETWGMAVQEAMSLGRPVIVSDAVGCHPDLVRPYETGLVVSAGELKALVKALQIALADPLRLQEWGEAAAQLSQRLSLDAATAGLRSALDAIAERCPR